MMRRNVVSYHPGHPNPFFYRPDYLVLNGPWDLVFDDDIEGFALQYQNEEPIQKAKSIQVPFSYETPASKINEKKQHRVLWYYKRFDAPHYPELVLLHLERVDYASDVYLNGHYLGRHVGAYDAFAYEISAFLQEKDNLLVVRVYEDNQDLTRLSGKQSWEKKPRGIFYPPTTGIYGDVWIESVPCVRLKGYDVRGYYDEKSAYFRMLFTHKAIGGQVDLTISYHGALVKRVSFPITGTYLESAVALPSSQCHAWFPGNPCLYDTEFQVSKDGKVYDRVQSYFGFNQIKIKDGYLYFNGKKRYPRFTLYQGYDPKTGLTITPEQALRDIKLNKQMGFNGFRIHQKVESEVFYYLCDREGLYTDLEMPSAQSYTPVGMKQALDTWGILVRDHVGHPSLCAYVPFNESWGLPNLNNNPEQIQVLKDAYAMAKRIDDTLPVVSNDGWQNAKTDLLCIHNYDADVNALKPFLEAQTEALEREEPSSPSVTDSRGLFLLGYRYEGQPKIISEFFGLSLASQEAKGWGYQEAKNIRAYLKTYRALLKAYKAAGYAGYCVTQFADTYQEKNGLVDEKRHPKASVESFRKSNKAF